MNQIPELADSIGTTNLPQIRQHQMFEIPENVHFSKQSVTTDYKLVLFIKK